MEVAKEEESEADGCEVDDQPSELRRKVLSGSALVLRRRNKWIRRGAARRRASPPELFAYLLGFGKTRL